MAPSVRPAPRAFVLRRPPRGNMVRVTVRVPAAHIESVRAANPGRGQRALLDDVARRAAAAGGLRSVRVALQDPTDETRFTVVGEAGAPRQADPLAHVERVRPVRPPPPPLPAPGADAAGALDPGLTDDDRAVLHEALAVEDNPRHLAGLATTFEPFYPISSTLLRTKSQLLESRVRRNRARMIDRNRSSAARTRTVLIDRFGAAAAPAVDRLIAWTHAALPAASSAARILDSATPASWSDVRRMWRRLLADMPREWFQRDRLAALALSRSADGPPPSTPPVDLNALRSSLDAYADATGLQRLVVYDEVRRLACRLIEEGHHHAVDSDPRPLDPARFAKVPRPILALATALVREVGLGLWLVCPERARILPVTGRERDVSPSALQMAQAIWKPEMAQVANPGRIKERMEALGRDSSPDAIRAKHQMEKAERALERRRWIEWYRRRRQAGFR